MSHLITIALGALVAVTAFGHGGGEMAIEIGPDKGITERSETQGFKLNPLAEKRLQLKFAPVTAGRHTIPSDAIVRALSETGVYRRRQGFIKRVGIEGLVRQSGKATFGSKELTTGDGVLIEGTGFVRMIEASFGMGESESEEEHAKHAAEGGEEKHDDHKEEGHKDHADEKKTRNEHGHDDDDHDDHKEEKKK